LPKRGGAGRRKRDSAGGRMRPILALGFFLLGLNGAAPEPEYASLMADSFHFARGASEPSLVAIESALGKGDREMVAVMRPTLPVREFLVLASLEAPDASALAGAEDDSPPASDVSLGELCNALLTSAQSNDLPVPFFANLLWQESGLRNDVVSSKGALGIAQFMPRTAEESGLHDPFDPLQAIPASARMLRALRMQFGNLGYVAAAYNAGARRVSEWLQRRRGLPRETRGYVASITCRSVDQWRTTPPDDTALKFVRRLPCRDLPAFASLEQEQQEQLKQAETERAQSEQAQGEQAQGEHAQTKGSHTFRQVAEARHRARRHAEARNGPHANGRHGAIHTAAHNIRHGKHQAERSQRGPHEKRKSA
jgi:Transglycosylase SLT domain